MKKFLLPILMIFAINLFAKVCPKCGADNPDDAKFCAQCGYKFEEKQETTKVEVVPKAKSKKDTVEKYTLKEDTGYVICPHCGARNPKYAKYCFMCGKPLLESKELKKSQKELYFEDERGLVPIKEFINFFDPFYSAIFIGCCNPLAAEINSKNALIFLPNSIYSVYSLSRGEVQIDLWVPLLGYIDPYIVTWQLNKFRRLVKKKK